MPLKIRCGYCGYVLIIWPYELKYYKNVATVLEKKYGFRCPRCLSKLDLNNRRVEVRTIEKLKLDIAPGLAMPSSYVRQIEELAAKLEPRLGDARAAKLIAFVTVLGHEYGQGDAYAGMVLSKYSRLVYEAVETLKNHGCAVMDSPSALFTAMEVARAVERCYVSQQQA